MSDTEDLQTKFEAAAKRITKTKPSDSEQLKLYGLFKQANKGDCTGSRPGMFSMVARAKYDAWKNNKGLSTDKAKEAYIKLVNKLLE